MQLDINSANAAGEALRAAAGIDVYICTSVSVVIKLTSKFLRGFVFRMRTDRPCAKLNGSYVIKAVWCWLKWVIQSWKSYSSFIIHEASTSSWAHSELGGGRCRRTRTSDHVLHFRARSSTSPREIS